MTDSGKRKFNVTYSHKHTPYWEVTHTDSRWWSVAYRPDAHAQDRYFITNSRGRVLDQHAPTGQKILAAVHDFERNGRPDSRPPPQRVSTPTRPGDP